MNNELVKVVEWVRWNGLTLNAGKCHYLLFHRSRRKLPDNIPDILLNNSILDRLSSTRYLGVYLDDNLNWSAHVGYISRKLSRYIPVIFKVRQCLTRESLKLLYNSLIYPHLIYCNTVWGSARNSHISSLINIQKKIIIILLFKGKYEHTAPLFNDLYLLTVRQINEYMSCLCVHKSLRLGNNLFSRYVPINYNTRLGGGNNVNVPNILSAHSRQSLRWVGSSNWNSLPQHLREIQEYNTFKIRLKKYLING